MFKRKKMGHKRSKRLFSKTARRVHKKNTHANPMRGGFRL